MIKVSNSGQIFCDSNRFFNFQDSANEYKFGERNRTFIKNQFNVLAEKTKFKRNITQQSMIESLNLNIFQYFCLKIKKIFFRKNELIENFELGIKLKKRIFNENTIYKIFFDLEKMKKVIFTKDQLKAFDFIKLDLNSLMIDLKLNKNEYVQCLSKLAVSNDVLSKKIISFFDEEENKK